MTAGGLAGVNHDSATITSVFERYVMYSASNRCQRVPAERCCACCRKLLKTLCLFQARDLSDLSSLGSTEPCQSVFTRLCTKDMQSLT